MRRLRGVVRGVRGEFEAVFTGIDALPKEELLGVLSEEDVNKLQKSPHQPMFCYSMMRRC